MPAWAAKIGLEVLRNPDRGIKWLFLGMMILLTAILMLCLPFFFLFIPAAEPNQFQYYMNAATRIQSETGQAVSWQEMMAIDAFMFKQDFSQSSAGHAYSFHRDLFIREEIREYSCSSTDENGNETSSTCYETVYIKRSLDEAMDRLGLSADDREYVKNYMQIQLTDEDIDPSLGIGPPTSTQPGNVTPVIGQFIWPSNYYRLTSGFGGRIDPVTGIPGENHGGIDIAAPIGSEVRAAMSGVVTFARFTETGGNIVTIDHRNGYATRYLHLDRLLVTVGDEVQQNSVIALSGNTGSRTTGAHLHFEIHQNGVKVDPMLFYR